jgi:hypothetical protein
MVKTGIIFIQMLLIFPKKGGKHMIKVLFVSLMQIND